MKSSVMESEDCEPIWGSWGVGDWVVDLGMEGTGAVVDRCSGMRQAFCMIGEGRLLEKGDSSVKSLVEWRGAGLA